MERSPVTLNNLVVILEALGRFDEAFPHTREAYERAPDDPRMARLYGEALLRRGDFATGWPIFARTFEPYSWLDPTVPLWQGEAMARLLVFATGGYGDNIYFLRWFRELRDYVDITYLCPPTLAPLARTLGIDVAINYNGNCDLDFESFDYHTPIHAIPQHMSWLPKCPYLRVSPRPRFHLRRRTGFCWRAGESPSPRRERTLNWAQRDRLLRVLPASTIDLSDLTGSWLDTARLIASLDLLVTVDTGVCHLACALGVPTWVILPGAASWHYPTLTIDPPIYPTLRMFRNRGEGLDFAVESAAHALEAL